MKAIGKIGVFLFLQLFIFPVIVFFVQFLIDYYLLGLNEPFRRPTWLGMVIMLMGPYFFTYSKWANENILNTKSSKPNNTSYTSLNEVVEAIEEPIDNNHDILSNINLPSLSTKEEDDKETLLKIEELKKQIESLLESKENLENSLKEDVLSLVDRQRIAEEKYFEEKRAKTVIGVLLFMVIIAGVAEYIGVL